jgi:hypothetical protein
LAGAGTAMLPSSAQLTARKTTAVLKAVGQGHGIKIKNRSNVQAVTNLFLKMAHTDQILTRTIQILYNTHSTTGKKIIYQP